MMWAWVLWGVVALLGMLLWGIGQEFLKPEVQEDWRLYIGQLRVRQLQRHARDVIQELEYYSYRWRLLVAAHERHVDAVLVDSLREYQRLVYERRPIIYRPNYIMQVLSGRADGRVTPPVVHSPYESEYDPEVFWTRPEHPTNEPEYGEIEAPEQSRSSLGGGATLDDLIARNDALEAEMREIDRKARDDQEKIFDEHEGVDEYGSLYVGERVYLGRVVSVTVRGGDEEDDERHRESGSSDGDSPPPGEGP